MLPLLCLNMIRTSKSNVCATFSLCYALFMAILFLVYFAQNHTQHYQIAIGAIVCGAIPFLLERFAKIRFHYLIITLYFTFLFGSQFLGSMMGFYDSISWWDTFLHCISGILIACIALDLLERLTNKGARKGMTSWFIFIYVLSVAVLGGVLWEIYEFSVDQLFGTTTQGGGNVDTMTDLIADSVGGIIVAIIAAFFRRK